MICCNEGWEGGKAIARRSTSKKQIMNLIRCYPSWKYICTISTVIKFNFPWLNVVFWKICAKIGGVHAEPVWSLYEVYINYKSSQKSNVPLKTLFKMYEYLNICSQTVWIKMNQFQTKTQIKFLGAVPNF